MTFPAGDDRRVQIRQTQTPVDGEMERLKFADVQNTFVVVDVLRAESQLGKIASIEVRRMVMVMVVMSRMRSSVTTSGQGHVVMLMMKRIMEDQLFVIMTAGRRENARTSNVWASLARISTGRGADV